jgi:hypothetical protein
MNATKMIVPDVPEDPAFLKAAARVSLTHAHLDYSLRMCIKTLTDVSIHEALEATEYAGPGILRKRIRKLAKARLGDGAPLVKLQAILKRCEDVTKERNDLIHNIVARDESGALLIRGSDHSWRDLPKSEKLDALAQRISGLANELHHVRLHGWLALAVQQTPGALGTGTALARPLIKWPPPGCGITSNGSLTA